MKTTGLIISVWLFATTVRSQDKHQAIDLRRLADELVSFQDEDVNYEDLYENLAQILSSPFDLNAVTAEELRLLHLLSDAQIESFVAYRREQGPLLDIYELQVIPEFDSVAIGRLLPFVRVIDPRSKISKSLIARMFASGNSYVITRYERTLESTTGFASAPGGQSAFAGSPDKYYFRFRSSVSGDFSLGITGEKDAGEKFMFDPGRSWGFDFTSCHLQLRNKGKLKNFIAGDFQSQFGQGLMLGGAFGLGKGGESISTTRKSSVGFQPYTSINEAGYQRGLAMTISPHEQVGVSMFYSGARRDASSGNESDSLTLTSFPTTGYHRTQQEILNRKKVSEKRTGIVVHFGNRKIDAGAIITHIHFSAPLKKTPTLYNQFSFTGSENANAGIFFNYTSANVSFFSELGKSFPGGFGGIAGILVSAHTNLDVAILYRNYMRNFQTFYSAAFSENTQAQNERGIYWGWKYRWNRQYSLNGYVDLFDFPWLAFRRYTPSVGSEWMLRGNYQPSKKVSIVVQFREETKDWNLPDITNLYKVGQRIRHNMSLHCDYEPLDNMRLITRVQYSAQDFNDQVTEGFAVMQDISFSLGKFQFTGRHGLFDTDHYDNRQYVYENDAFSSYSLPAYSGVGVRKYALFEYKVTKQLTVWLRYSRTRVTNSGETGSGLDAIEVNTRNDVKFQARLRF